MSQVDFQAAAELAKISMRGIRSPQLGRMTVEEKDRGYDLVVEYTKAPKFEEGVQALTLSIRFNSMPEATHAREILRHGTADLGADPVPFTAFGRDPAFVVDL